MRAYLIGGIVGRNNKKIFKADVNKIECHITNKLLIIPLNEATFL